MRSFFSPSVQRECGVCTFSLCSLLCVCFLFVCLVFFIAKGFRTTHFRERGDQTFLPFPGTARVTHAAVLGGGGAAPAPLRSGRARAVPPPGDSAAVHGGDTAHGTARPSQHQFLPPGYRAPTSPGAGPAKVRGKSSCATRSLCVRARDAPWGPSHPLCPRLVTLGSPFAG